MSKNKKTYYSIQTFYRYVRNYKRRFATVFIVFVCSNILLALMPLFIGKLVGVLAANPVNGHQAVIYVWLLIICSSGHNLTWRLGEFVHMKLILPLGYEYENVLFKQVIEKPYPYFVDKFTGKISSYITTISTEIRGLVDNLFYEYTSQFVGMIVIAIILTSINWQTGAIFLVGILCMFLVGRRTIRNTTKYEKISADVQSTKNGKLIDAIANFVNIKSFQKESAELSMIVGEQKKTIKAANKSYVWSIIFWGSMGFFVRDIMWPATIGLNVYLFLHHQISISQLATLLSTILIFSSSVWQLVWHLSQFNLRLSRIEEAHRYLFGDEHAVVNNKENHAVISKTLVFEHELKLNNLYFAYPDKLDTNVLNNINLSLKKGEKLGIVGRSGSGKTTLTKLLLGYYEISGDQILLDGSNISGHDLAKLISYVPQDTSLFHRSVAENIAYATDQEVTRADIIEAAKKAHAHEFISQISDGYDALVGERGVKLSAGQRQRIAIARALLDNKPLLILDEATSALDSESEVLVQQGLEALWEHKTVIAIAHRLSTLRHMDKIIVMDKGQIVEQGTHEELLKAKGTYAKLWNHQSGGFIEE
ncbi:MAG: transporter related [Candidatus Saccharibacteria bacterium]|nr:transporter related [Candidatus Saccharibacteria bacterium]